MKKPKNESCMEAIQGVEIAKVLDYVMINSPFYKKRFKDFRNLFSEGFDLEKFKSLPFTSKEDIARNNKEFCCVKREDIAEYMTTSGTLGEPITVFLTKNDLKRLAENEKASLTQMNGNDKDLYQLLTTLDKQFMAGLAYYTGVLKMNASIIRLGPGAIPMQWKSILNNEPTKLIAVPSFIPKLINYAESNGIDHKNSSVDSIICIGEPIRNNDFSLNSIGKAIKDKWDVKLFSTYASTEMATAFSECKYGVGGHLNSDLLHLEVLNDNDEQVKNGEPGEIVITTLRVEGTPLVRYKTGDIATFWKDKCPCDKDSVRIGPILGRKNQVIKFKGTTIYPQSIFNVLNSITSISTFCVEVHQDDLTANKLKVLLAEEQVSQIILEDIRTLLQAELKVLPEIDLVPQNKLNSIIFTKDKRKPNLITFK